MQRPFLIALCLLTACSRQTEQVITIKQLRSAAAEWAFVNHEAARKHLTAAYVDGMRKAARKQIDKAAASLRDPRSDAARQAAALQALPPDAPSDLLSQHAAALKTIEDHLESA